MSGDLKVLVISHLYPSSFKPEFGIFVHEQVRELKRQGCDVKVVSPVPWTPFPVKLISKKWRGYAGIPESTVMDGVEVYYPRYLSFPKALFFEYSGRLMYRGIQPLVDQVKKEFDFDIIHAHVALPDGFAGMNAAEKFNKPFIVTIHGHDFFVTLNKNERCRQAVKKVLSCADRVITVSSKLKKIAGEIMEDEKSVTISNGIPDSLKKTETVKERLKDSVLSVSYLIARKGIDYNLMAVAKLVKKYVDLKYYIIGDGDEQHNLKKLVSRLNLEDHVVFLGRLPHEEVFEYMSRCDVFSLPSWNEAFGVVYIEAMACGKPVIACRGEGIEDVIEDKKTGMLVEPRNAGSLAGALDFLLGSPGEARLMGERARELVLNNLTWENNARKNIELYKEVISDEKK